MIRRILGFMVFLSALFWGLSVEVRAAPYFFVTGDSGPISGYLYHYSVYLYTDSQTVTAAQTVLNFDPTKLQLLSTSTLNSRCTFWAPADPALVNSTQTTPYVHNNNQVIIACGFSNPGYKSNSSYGDLIVKLMMTPVNAAAGPTQLNLSNSLLRYIGTVITPASPTNLSLTVYPSTESAFPTITPQPTVTPANPRTVSSSDLNLVSVGTGSGTANSQSIAFGTLPTVSLINPTIGVSQGNLDDTIPPPPALMTPRPTEAPVIESEADKKTDPLGEVLSIQSLKELLLPNKSEADQKVVFVNLLSTLAFLVILAILIWRLIIVSRINRVKYRHMKEIVSGELAALESQLGSEVSEETRNDISQRMEEIRQGLEKSR